MAAQLSLKAVLPLTERPVTASDRCSKTEPWASAEWYGGSLPRMLWVQTKKVKKVTAGKFADSK